MEHWTRVPWSFTCSPAARCPRRNADPICGEEGPGQRERRDDVHHLGTASESLAPPKWSQPRRHLNNSVLQVINTAALSLVFEASHQSNAERQYLYLNTEYNGHYFSEVGARTS
jgi:hypothetical protein